MEVSLGLVCEWRSGKQEVLSFVPLVTPIIHAARPFCPRLLLYEFSSNIPIVLGSMKNKTKCLYVYNSHRDHLRLLVAKAISMHLSN